MTRQVARAGVGVAALTVLAVFALAHAGERTHRVTLDVRRATVSKPEPERTESVLPTGGAPVGAAADSTGTSCAARRRVVRIAATAPERGPSGEPEL